MLNVVYGGRHRQWLPAERPYHFIVNVFTTEEVECAPAAMDGTNHIQWAFMRAKYERFSRRLGGEGDLVLCHGVKRLSALYTLPYSKVNIRSH